MAAACFFFGFVVRNQPQNKLVSEPGRRLDEPRRLGVILQSLPYLLDAAHRGRVPVAIVSGALTVVSNDPSRPG